MIKITKIEFLGAILIVMPLVNPIFSIITAFVISKGDLGFVFSHLLFTRFFYRIYTAFSYTGIECLFDALFKICPIYQAKNISIILMVIKIYIPLFINLALLVGGIGFFFRYRLFRYVAIVALTALALLGIIDIVMLYIYHQGFSVLKLLMYMLYLFFAYYLTRPKVKEQFK